MLWPGCLINLWALAGAIHDGAAAHLIGALLHGKQTPSQRRGSVLLPALSLAEVSRPCTVCRRCVCTASNSCRSVTQVRCTAMWKMRLCSVCMLLSFKGATQVSGERAPDGAATCERAVVRPCCSASRMPRRYLENVPTIVPLLEKEYRLALRRLEDTQDELADLHPDKCAARCLAGNAAYMQHI